MKQIKLRPTKEAIINAVNILECLIRSGVQHETYWTDENGDGFEGDQGYINEGLESINEEDYKEVLLHILTQKNRQLKDSDHYIRKGKLIRHALSKGFESYLITEVLLQLH